MTILGFILLAVAVVMIVMAVRAWGPSGKSKIISGVYVLVALLLLYLSGALGFLSTQLG